MMAKKVTLILINPQIFWIWRHSHVIVQEFHLMLPQLVTFMIGLKILEAGKRITINVKERDQIFRSGRRLGLDSDLLGSCRGSLPVSGWAFPPVRSGYPRV
jgi:hypothetical protein